MYFLNGPEDELRCYGGGNEKLHSCLSTSQGFEMLTTLRLFVYFAVEYKNSDRLVQIFDSFSNLHCSSHVLCITSVQVNGEGWKEVLSQMYAHQHTRFWQVLPVVFQLILSRGTQFFHIVFSGRHL